MQCVSDYSMHFWNLGIHAVTIRMLGQWCGQKHKTHEENVGQQSRLQGCNSVAKWPVVTYTYSDKIWHVRGNAQ